MATLHPWPDRTLSSNKRRVIQELVEGKKCAAELQIIVDQEHSQQGSSAEELVQKILTSFDQTISMLTFDHEVSQNQDDCRSQESSEGSKGPAAVSKERRGCYKRKRGAETWTVLSDNMEDCHAWRKYGQKNILNSKHPRSYFRCKHKCNQGCRAVKQVQRIEDDDSQMYHITYIGTHTCRDSSPHDMVPSNNSGVAFKKHHSSPFDGLSSTLKHESEEEMTPSDVSELNSVTMWEDVVLGGGCGFESGYGDVVSDMYSCNEVCCLNLEPVGLENGFQFDDTEFV
ncbi:WRKY DNA-binding protein 70, ARABIDOPSIS THALIANA WRKY DNA-BINDING PROTEIN 70 [Hibiscus trionum]|uniref:WRKY DNA-binding protein 70, ARABIDOPSIS THALIANA WRKY DNA-BINDING PROTEIN 70 n=1 Tax=Hibiscus trionum TaxID=183268 RepID=A0A9W7H7K5_HIBTR|nr:WRKY DNA-binding protein 70, ARABIDOPSIS THALIANA WRKY DNA-BINDING PROTEIN 70 [Hibiscus trionum]